MKRHPNPTYNKRNYIRQLLTQKKKKKKKHKKPQKKTKNKNKQTGRDGPHLFHYNH